MTPEPRLEQAGDAYTARAARERYRSLCKPERLQQILGGRNGVGIDAVTDNWVA